MEKLNKVIAGLTGCIVGNCSNCEYGGNDCGRDRLMEDALEMIKHLREKLKMAKDGRLELARQIQGWMEYFGGLQYYNGRWYNGLGNVVEVEPVVHAHWIMRGGRRYCSACGTMACVTRDTDDFWYTVGTKRCPECGAHMDEEVADG